MNWKNCCDPSGWLRFSSAWIEQKRIRMDIRKNGPGAGSEYRLCREGRGESGRQDPLSARVTSAARRQSSMALVPEPAFHAVSGTQIFCKCILKTVHLTPQNELHVSAEFVQMRAPTLFSVLQQRTEVSPSARPAVRTRLESISSS